MVVGGGGSSRYWAGRVVVEGGIQQVLSWTGQGRVVVGGRIQQLLS